jgi:hypothetical protein
MPNWKKVIVSGSDAALNSLNVTTSLTASGLIYPTVDGTAGQVLTTNGAGSLSFSSSSISASYAITASYAIFAETASSALNAQDILILVKNQSGAPIAKGVVVRITGSNNASDIPRVITASYENDNNSANTLGITNQSIANGADGFVMTEGVLKGINTNAFVSGQLIYLGATGSIIGYAPVAPLHSVRLGEVVREQSNNGSIYVRIDNGYELGELHDVVDTTTTSSYGDLLVKSGSVWTNSRQLTGSYGLTGSLTATSFTGSLFGTASWAINALTASYTPSIAGTDNYIPKFNGSSALENSVMYDDGTNIGIGTTSPSTKLHIAENNTTSYVASSVSLIQPDGGANLLIQNTGTGGFSSLRFVSLNGSNAIGYIGFDNSTASVGGDFVIGQRNGGSSYTEQVRITNAGNVGIGTTSPTNRLQVTGTAGLNNAITSFDSSTFVRIYADATFGSSVNWVTGTALRFATSANNFGSFTERMRIDSSGNVGIGTTSPSTRLDVRYDDGVSSGEHNVLASFSRSGTGPLVIGYRADGSSVSSALIRIGDSLPLTIGTTSANQAFTLLDNGNIGIGNSSPNGALSFADDVRTRKIVLWDGAANNDYQFYGFGVESSTMIQSVYDSTDRFLWVAGTGTTTRNELMVVQGNGNVGIGTSSPSYKLDVSGQQRITLAGYAGIEYHNTPGTWEVYIGTENNTGNARYNSRIGNHTWYANSSATMALSASGAFRLNSYGSGTFTGTATQKLAVDSSGNVIEIPIGAGPVDGSGTANYITRWVDTDTITTSSIYETGGNIGIGITSPSYKLSINGSAGIEASEEYLYFNSSYTVGSNARAKIRAVGAGGGSGYGGDLRISTRQQNNNWNEDAVTIDSTGNVGIGTTTPGALLQIGTSTVTTDSILRLSVAYAGDRASRGGITWHDTSNTTGKIYTEYDGTMTSMVFGSLYNSGYNSNQLMIIRGNGNVGIGTTTPAYRLSVVGKLDLNDGGNSIFIGTNAGLSDDATSNSNIAIGTNASQNNISGSQNVAIGHNALVTNTTINNSAIGANAMRFNTTGDSNTGIGSFALWQTVDGRENTGVGAASLLFNTSGSSNTGVGANALRANTSGSSNTGIGLSALSTNTLGNENTAIGRNAGRYYSTGTSANTNASASIFIGFNSRANNTGETNQIVIGNEALGLGNNTIVLGNDNIVTTALKGNVGIGTTSPTKKLHVVSSGNEGIFMEGSANGGHWFDFKSANSNLWSMGAQPGLMGWYNRTDSTYKMVITDAGNVGIGTTSPAYKLDIDSGSETLAARFFNSSAAQSAIAIGDSGNSNYSNLQLVVDSGVVEMWKGGSAYSGWGGALSLNIYNSNGAIAFHPNNTANAMFINTSGNVGIKTTNPYYPLVVNGIVGIENANELVLFDLGNVGASTIRSISGGLIINTNSTSDALNILSGGNVGIGNSSPSYKLDVNGTARVTTLIETSALKYKTNIQPLDSQLSKVIQLEPVTFDWIDKPNPKTNIGLIADEVEKIYPEFVSKTEDGEIEGIEYSKLTTVLIQSIKELKEIVDKQQEQINALLNK